MQLFQEMDFGFLFDPSRKLFSIGFRVWDGELDPSCYDLLASECRLASFLAIAKGEVTPDHWFRLGRALTPIGRGSALISWSGSMFEYLMPALVMRAPANSLLEQTNRLVVARQMRYATALGVPWGISESGFNARDLAQAYQYSSFGVPGLGLKRGLGDDLVVAPYATALAAMIEPKEAARNFVRLRKAGASGRYGFREALDYTERRLPEGASVAIVRSYMAHHQGMALVALGNVLNDRVMVERFHADPIVEATELLLQERLPRDVVVAQPRAEEVRSDADVRDLVPPILRRFTSPHDAIPRTHVMSNGRYAVMVTAAGSGYSRWGDVAVTRWREDVTRDSWGSYLFMRDMYTGKVWSAGHQPSGTEADTYEVIFSEDRAEFSRRDGSIVTGLTVVVSAEHDAEIRRVSLTNLSSHDREIELTSYAEIVLAPQAADVAHPAFQNLFVQTEFDPAHRRAPGDPPSSIRRREADLGRARRGRRRPARRGHPVRDRPCPFHRQGPVGPIAGLGHRRPPPVEHGRCGVGPDLQPPASGDARPRRDRPRDLLHGRRRFTRAGPRPGRQVPRIGDVRAGRDPGVDAGPGPAPSPRHRAGRSPSLPAPGEPDPLLGSVAAAVGGGAGQQRARRVRAVGPRHLRRPAHRHGPDRRGRGPRDRPPAAACP